MSCWSPRCLCSEEKVDGWVDGDRVLGLVEEWEEDWKEVLDKMREDNQEKMGRESWGHQYRGDK